MRELPAGQREAARIGGCAGREKGRREGSAVLGNFFPKWQVA